MSDPRRGEARNHLREWRRLTGLTQLQVERYFGWGKSRLSHVENGRALLTDEVLKSLSELYKCTPEELLLPPPGRRRPRRRPRRQWPVVERGDVTLEAVQLPDTITMLRALSEEVRSLKRDLLPRLDMLEGQIDATTNAAIIAVENASEVTAMFERGLHHLKNAIDPQLVIARSAPRGATEDPTPPDEKDEVAG